MVRKIKTAATNIGIGIGAVYAFFLIPSIEELFKLEFIILLRQGLAISFAVCLLINPKSLVDAGYEFAPKLIAMLQLFFGNKNKDHEENSN